MKEEESLAFATIEELSALLAKHKISPVELTGLFLRRIELQNPALNAFQTVTAEHALAAAKRRCCQMEARRCRTACRASSRREDFPAPRDTHHAQGQHLDARHPRSTAGSKILRDFVPPEDSTVARKLARAGAVLLGKTNLNEFAYGITGANAHYGPVHNPWALDRISGGSERRLGRYRDCRGPLRTCFHPARTLAARSVSHPLLRDRQVETNLRARQRLWHYAALAVLRSRRSDRPQRCGCGHPPRPDRRARFTGPNYLAKASGGFPRRAARKAPPQISSGPSSRALLGKAGRRSAPRGTSGPA